jgi:hypothetical protein
MRYARWFAGIVCLGLTASCSTVQDYPRCYLFRAPEERDVQASNGETRELFGGTVRVIDFCLGKDAVAVRAPAAEHKKLAEIWPEFGCVNLRREHPLTAESNDKWIVARCQQYLQQLVALRDKSISDTRTDVAARHPQFTCH